MKPENRPGAPMGVRISLDWFGTAVVLFGVSVGAAWAGAPKPEVEPRAFSIYPLGNQPGAAYPAEIRGIKLGDASALWFEADGIQARIVGTRRDPESDPNASTPTDLVDLQVT